MDKLLEKLPYLGFIAFIIKFALVGLGLGEALAFMALAAVIIYKDHLAKEKTTLREDFENLLSNFKQLSQESQSTQSKNAESLNSLQSKLDAMHTEYDSMRGAINSLKLNAGYKKPNLVEPSGVVGQVKANEEKKRYF